MAKPIPTELWGRIKETYLQVKSIRGTALELGLSKSGVEYVLKQLEVARFPRNRKGVESSSSKSLPPDSQHPRRIIRDVKAMTEMYVIQRQSIPDIAKVLGLGVTTVRNGLIHCGVQLRTRAQGIKGKPRPKSQGPRHRDWRGGVTEYRKRARQRLNVTFVRPVMERDNFKCRLCGSTRRIVVHHVRGFAAIIRKVKKETPVSDMELFIDAIVKEHTLDDGVTLCKKCHDHHHKIYGKDQDRLDI